ncbi:MAG: CTP synthase [Bryobacteraceae bacterium]
MRKFRAALVGDFDPTVVAHRAIPEALRMANAEYEWIHTTTLREPPGRLAGFDGIWCVPASPYADMQGALDAIRFAREQNVPFLGTCGGFQHALIEYARNVLGISGADHAESNPEAADLIIAPLACSLVEESEEITLAEGTLIRNAYGQERVTEGYHCRYGVNPNFAERLFSGFMRTTAWDASGQVRAAELVAHQFFVLTLFQPERRALRGELPPLVRAFTAQAV